MFNPSTKSGDNSPVDAENPSFLAKTSTFVQDLTEKETILYQIPPDLELCRKHAKACLIRKPYAVAGTKIKKCFCCGAIYNTEPIAICEDAKQLSVAGFAVSLYYTLMKYLSYKSLFLIFPACLLVFFNTMHGFGDENNKIDQENAKAYWINGSTLANIDRDSIPIFAIGMTIIVVLLYMLWVTFRRMLYSYAVILDVEHRTPSDYSFVLNNLPILPQSIDQKELIQKLGGEEKIEKITYAYDLTHFEKLCRDIATKKRIKKTIECYKERFVKLHPKATLKEIEQATPRVRGKVYDYDVIMKEIQKLETEKSIIENYFVKNDEVTNCLEINLVRTPVAFVTYSYTKDMEEIMSKYEGNFLEKFLGRGKLDFMNKKVNILPAPEPEDVFWNHQHFSTTSRIIRTLITWMVSACLLLCTYFLNRFIGQYAKELSDQNYSSIVIDALNILTSFVVISVNRLLALAIGEMTMYEKRPTKTDYQLSVAFKLTVAMFFNTAIIPFFLNRSSDKYFSEVGLVGKVFFNWVSIGIMGPLLEYFDIFSIHFYIRKWILICKGKGSQMTQQDANAAFEPPPVRMPKRFAEAGLIMLYTGVYLPLLPIGIFLTVLALVANYWMDKYLMLRRFKKPPKLSGIMSLYTMNLIFFMIPLCIYSNCFFTYYLNDNDPTAIYATIIVTIIISLCIGLLIYLHKKTKNECYVQILKFFVINYGIKEFVDENENIPYDFTNDYMFFNPPCQKKSIKLCHKYYERKERERQLKKTKIQMMQSQLQFREEFRRKQNQTRSQYLNATPTPSIHGSLAQPSRETNINTTFERKPHANYFEERKTRRDNRTLPKTLGNRPYGQLSPRSEQTNREELNKIELRFDTSSGDESEIGVTPRLISHYVRRPSDTNSEMSNTSISLPIVM